MILSVASLGSLVLFLFYLPTLRRAAKSYRDSSAIVSGMMEELNSRAATQDKRLADIQVKLEVLEERWLRSGWTPTRASEDTDSHAGWLGRAPRSSGGEPGSPHLVSLPTGLGGKVSAQQAGSKPTRVELFVLERLTSGRLTAPQVKEILGSSREHAARTMKSLADKGLVVRDLSKRPYSYELSDSGRGVVTAS